MRIFMLALALAGALSLTSCLVPAAEPIPRPDSASAQSAKSADDHSARLQSLSLTIHAGSAQGTGVIFTRGGQNYVLSAGHVVDGLRSTLDVIVDGSVKTKVKFAPCTVDRELYQDGRSVGHTRVEGEVIAFSSAEHGHDLALIKLRYKISDDSAAFAKEPTPIAAELLHVGSLLGQDGSNSVTTGILSQIGRVLFDRVFDQTSCTAFPGSSGGGVYVKSTGEYMGTLVRGAGETFNLIVPVRRIREWAAAHKVEFLFEPKAKPDLTKVRLEIDEPAGDSGSYDGHAVKSDRSDKSDLSDLLFRKAP